MVRLIFGISGLFVFSIFMIAVFFSRKEQEKIAAKRFLMLAVAFSSPYFFIAWKMTFIPEWLGFLLLVSPLVFIFFLIIPFDPVRKTIEISPLPGQRHDERDIMFSRRRLQPGTERFKGYYQTHPERKALDDEWRQKPGLLNPEAKFYHPLYFNAAEASFDAIEYFYPHVQPRINEHQQSVPSEEITQFIKDWLLRSGAHSVGVTRLQEYHLYSHRGRQEPYGTEIVKEHEYAIAFTVEMDKAMVDFAPTAPTVLESADQYLRAGTLAIKVARFIARLGYQARAHIDGNYQVICPLVARDAGLGEIGRMGLLMTPELGPRVRIAVITTNLTLMTDAYQPDPTVIDFCNRCKKCAINCPSKAIPFDQRQWDQDILRWKINPEVCFSYWCSVGTDCARCMKVCPYSHPNNAMHKLIRTLIKRNSVARYLAIKLDDLLYGKHPEMKKDLRLT